MKNSVYISVVSHGQENLIIENFAHLITEIQGYKIRLCLVDNTGSEALKIFAAQHGHLYFHDGVRRGFGANHNKGFEVCNPSNDDVFIVCNPDIILDNKQLEGMVSSFEKNSYEMSNVECFYNREKTIRSNADRHFPCFLNFVFSIALGRRFHYGSNENVEFPEWVSGEFFLIKPAAYKKIDGFDEDYFMYVEDVDFSYRIRQAGFEIFHDKKYFIIHETQMASRSLFSKSFLMHLKSVWTYLYKNKRLCLIKVTK